ncbi:prenyltransferase/squalene oxidase repeat-containing protein [Rubritalea marina]|uniref:prenyltransferase/squalene oxidase repeat-containing protein n=1 Tax=Rubritalea marina TaxID=361055 RepID=UPI0003A113D5|nr:prenyltransferase/squalene oxidase repeat-containing protein [Rubritalea marina]
MSLHTPPSNEAKAALAAQQRISTISSITISILATLLLGLLLYLVNLVVTVKKEPTFLTSLPQAVQEPDKPSKPKIANQVPKRPSLPTPALTPDFTPELSTPDMVVPTPPADAPLVTFIEFDEPESEFQDILEDTLEPYQNLPTSMKKRCSKEERLARLNESGGNEACEDAVVRSLQHFARTQAENGAWHNESNYPVGYTGLALLSFLGHCETTTSPNFGHEVEKAIAFLVNVSMKNEGRLGSDFNNNHWPYEHAICTYALAEAYTLCKNDGVNLSQNLEEAVRRSANFIIQNQDKQLGGWGYGYTQTGKAGAHVDTSVSCWQLQAIKAAAFTNIEGIKRPDTAAMKGLEYLASAQLRNGAFQYTSHGGSPTMTGGAVLCFQQWGKGSRSQAKKGIAYIDQSIGFDFHGTESDLYAHYYYGQALMNVGGSYWTKYNALFRDSLLGAQLADGTYQQPGDGGPINGVATESYSAQSPAAIHYRTALATLMLEVYYRFLPTSFSQ